jgi:hypothetical protein
MWQTKQAPTPFCDAGEVDDSLFTYQPSDFDVGLGLPAMAKIGLSILLSFFPLNG